MILIHSSNGPSLPLYRSLFFSPTHFSSLFFSPFLCLPLYLSFHLALYLPIYLSVYLSIYLCICLSNYFCHLFFHRHIAPYFSFIYISLSISFSLSLYLSLFSLPFFLFLPNISSFLLLIPTITFLSYYSGQQLLMMQQLVDKMQSKMYVIHITRRRLLRQMALLSFSIFPSFYPFILTSFSPLLTPLHTFLLFIFLYLCMFDFFSLIFPLSDLFSFHISTSYQSTAAVVIDGDTSWFNNPQYRIYTK